MYVLAVSAIVLVLGARSQPVTDQVKPTELQETKTTAQSSSMWKGTPMNAVVQEFRSECAQQTDSGACVKVKVLDVLEDVLRKDTFKVSEIVSLVPNDKEPKQRESEGRSENSFMDQLEEYIESHDVVVKAPFLADTAVKISPRNLDEDKISVTVQLPRSEEGATGRRRKSKLRKILVPILVFVLLKAMTLIPLAIGVLSLKAWNALNLSFIAFLVSISLAIFQLCKKVAIDSTTIPAHIPFESYPSHYAAAAARNFLVEPQRNTLAEQVEEDGQNLAYRAHANNQS